MSTLRFMHPDAEPETFRPRIYGGNTDEDGRIAFVTALAGPGMIDCQAYDEWVAKLQERGWLPAKPDLEPNPDGPGKIGRWRLTEVGRTEWAAMLETWKQQKSVQS